MATIQCCRNKSAIRALLFSGVMWIGLALFGLIADPSKRLIIIVQIAAGLISLLYYLWLQKTPMLRISGNMLNYRKGFFSKKQIPIEKIDIVEEQQDKLFIHQQDDDTLAIPCTGMKATELTDFIKMLRAKIRK